MVGRPSDSEKVYVVASLPQAPNYYNVGTPPALPVPRDERKERTLKLFFALIMTIGVLVEVVFLCGALAGLQPEDPDCQGHTCGSGAAFSIIFTPVSIVFMLVLIIIVSAYINRGGKDWEARKRRRPYVLATLFGVIIMTLLAIVLVENGQWWLMYLIPFGLLSAYANITIVVAWLILYQLWYSDSKMKYDAILEYQNK